ncbi:MAG: T9SS type A sorting domain-containing protein, partial [Ignavibacteria bacterium]
EWSGSKIYKSTDFGDTWAQNHTTGFSGWGSDICREDPNVIVTGSWGAAATMSLDGGVTWTNISSGLNGHGGGILIPDRGYMVCHQGSNVYKLNVQYTVLTSVSENLVSSVPVDFNLSQNYPNPFNPSTRINYSLPKSDNVSIKIYNELGREVSTLVNGFKTAGTYEITFDGANLSSGIYFYKLQTTGFTATKKMLLIK